MEEPAQKIGADDEDLEQLDSVLDEILKEYRTPSPKGVETNSCMGFGVSGIWYNFLEEPAVGMAWG